MKRYHVYGVAATFLFVFCLMLSSCASRSNWDTFLSNTNSWPYSLGDGIIHCKSPRNGKSPRNTPYSDVSIQIESWSINVKMQGKVGEFGGADPTSTTPKKVCYSTFYPASGPVTLGITGDADGVYEDYKTCKRSGGLLEADAEILNRNGDSEVHAYCSN